MKEKKLNGKKSEMKKSQKSEIFFKNSVLFMNNLHCGIIAVRQNTPIIIEDT